MPKEDSVDSTPDDVSLSDILMKGLVGETPDDEANDDPSDGDSDEELEDEDEASQRVSDSDVEEDEGDKPTKPQYKTQAEAEKAAKEAKKKMHEATQELAKMRQRVAYMEGKVAGTGKEEVPQDPMEVIAKKTAGELAKLDKNAEDYNEQVVKVFAKQARDIANIEQKRVGDTEQSEQTYINYINSKVEEAGLKNYMTEFWAIAPAVPNHIETLDEAVDWGINAVKKLIKKVQGDKDKKKQDKDNKEKDTFTLGRGGNRPVPRKGEGNEEGGSPKSLSDALKTLRKARVFKS